MSVIDDSGRPEERGDEMAEGAGDLLGEGVAERGYEAHVSQLGRGVLGPTLGGSSAISQRS